MVPKFMMGNGLLVRTLVHTGVHKYLEFKAVDGSYVFKGGKVYKVRTRATSGRTVFPSPRARSPPTASLTFAFASPFAARQVPPDTTLWSPLMSLFEKRRARNFFIWTCSTRTTRRPTKAITSTWSPAVSFSPSFGLEASTVDFVGHAVALVRRTIPTSTVPRVRW